MAAVTICRDFGAPQHKVCHCLHCFPIYFPWSDDPKQTEITWLVNSDKDSLPPGGDLWVLDYFNTAAAAAAKSLQSCPTLCDPVDGSPPGSPVPGILQARTLEWVAISFSNAWKVKVKSLSRVRLFATPWTAAYQAPPSLGFARQEYWLGLESCRIMPVPVSFSCM